MWLVDAADVTQRCRRGCHVNAEHVTRFQRKVRNTAAMLVFLSLVEWKDDY